MALTQYSRNITDGLILHLDAANPNSYRGENTANQIFSETNSFPTYGNGWGTYNTNQYGNGTFFSIGSIASVSGNVVTTSGNHPLRTYDVMRPQTSGGGLTANTDYYIKKVSNTQFTLHTYNSTQDGTLGFRVLDPIVRDDRISVNATSFPTMWWGAPHLPNSAIIKTIVPNGFNFEGRIHDCLRMNWYRPDGVTDGMAYGVTPTISPGNATWTLSCYMRAANSAAIGQSVNWQSYSTSNATTWVANSFGPMSTEWQKFNLTGVPWSASSSATALLLYWFPNSAPMAVDIAEIQIEQKTAPRVFTPAYRGSTFSTGSSGNNLGHQFNGYLYSGGWSDLSQYRHESTISTGDPTFTTDFGGAVQFTASQGYTIPYNNAFDCQEMTVLVWAKTNATTQNGFWFEKGTVNTQYSLFQEGGNLQWRTYFTEGFYDTQSTTTSSYLNTSNYFQVAGTYNGQQKVTYINGSAVTTTSINKQMNYNASGCTVGMYNSNGYYYNGNIAIVQVYNRALSAAEILDNYNKYKSRFGL
jgi:hypothetical protein